MLKIENVSVEFRGAKVKAVDGFSLDIEDGERVAIVGETGSGKSVLIVAMIRLLPSNASVSGRVLLDGEDILAAGRERLHEIRGGIISYVPQGGGGSMNPLHKIGYQVGEPLMIHKGFTKKEAVDASLPLLERFNLVPSKEILEAYPHMLSGGMRQRAMVAMGIAAGARYILADEPTKGLDDRRVKMVVECFNSLGDETLLCVTHDLLFAKAVSRKICVMYAAQQLEYGTTEEIFQKPLHPYTKDLLDAMPENGMVYDDQGFAPPHDSYFDELGGCRYRDRCHECMECCKNAPPVVEIGDRKVRCWKYASCN